MNAVTRPRRILVPFLAILGIIAASAGGGVITFSAIESGWYASLPKPPGNPPNWVFGPVWTCLYILIGISFWRAWTRSESRALLAAFATQITLNFLWSAVFFGLRSPAMAVVVVLAMLAAIAWELAVSLRIDRPSGFMLLPYLAWVSFASYLNIAVAIMSRS